MVEDKTNNIALLSNIGSLLLYLSNSTSSSLSLCSDSVVTDVLDSYRSSDRIYDVMMYLRHLEHE